MMYGLKHLILVSVLFIALAGCATKPITVREVETVEVVRYETVPVPEALLAPCTITLRDLVTNGDLEQSLAAAIIALQSCTADKEAIRALR